MYTLRRITSSNVEINECIGRSYTFIHRHYNYDDFCRSFEAYFEKPHVSDLEETADDDTKNVYAFISHADGTIQPLYMNQQAYIMTESGKTFSNLTYKLN